MENPDTYDDFSINRKENPELQKKIAEAVFLSEALLTPEELERKYPERELPPEAMITRVGPSPTGFMHIGGIYMALISERFAHQTDGIYYLRIEDTDRKREVDGARKVIVDSLHNFGLDPDEGEKFDGLEHGNYGPYCQSERREVYGSYIKSLLTRGDAYLCFCSEEELEAMQKMQETLGVRRGYCGPWAKWRDASQEKVLDELSRGTPYVVRFRSQGDPNKIFTHHDLLKGDVILSENDLDAVIMKSDGLPTYHLAHAVDDHLMRTSHVLRGDEWLPSVPLHYELFKTLGFDLPEYAHISPINKLDNGNKRKLSKRKDPEANVSFYQQKGYPPEAVLEYLLNLANSDFEDWRKENPNTSYKEFELKMSRLANSNGPLFDESKLRDTAKEIISKMSADQIFENVLNWAEINDYQFFTLLNNDKEYWTSIFGIERGGSNSRKDISAWSDVRGFYEFFDKGKYQLPNWGNFVSIFNTKEIKEIFSEYLAIYDENDSKVEWLEKIRQLCIKYNLAPNLKTYKADKTNFRGHIGDLTQCIRFAITGRTQSPDIFEIIKILGKSEVFRRLA